MRVTVRPSCGAFLVSVRPRKPAKKDLRLDRTEQLSNSYMKVSSMLGGQQQSRGAEDAMKEACKENCPEVEDESNDISVYLRRWS